MAQIKCSKCSGTEILAVINVNPNREDSIQSFFIEHHTNDLKVLCKNCKDHQSVKIEK